MATVNLQWTPGLLGGTLTTFKIWRYTGDLNGATALAAGSTGANDDAFVVANGAPVTNDATPLSTFPFSAGDYEYADTNLASNNLLGNYQP